MSKFFVSKRILFALVSLLLAGGSVISYFYFFHHGLEVSWKTQKTLTQIIKTLPKQKLITNVERVKQQEKGYTVSLAKVSNTTDPVTFTTGNGSISFASFGNSNFGPANAVSITTDGNKTTYDNIYNGVSLIYTSSPTKLLEEYEIKVKRPVSEIIQKIDTAGVTPQAQPDGSIVFNNNQTGKFAFALPRPVMYEAANTMNRNYDLHYEITTINGQTYLIKVIDPKGQAWLQNLAHYPVMIDATVSLTLFSYESYPVLHNTWQIRLDTVGQGNLNLSLGEGTLSSDIILQSLTCGSQTISVPSNGTIPNFSCPSDAIATYKLNNTSQHSIVVTYSGATTTIQSPPQDQIGKPIILSASINPPVVKVGDIITVTAHVAADAGIHTVTADMGGIDTINLNKTQGETTNGTWSGSWQVHATTYKQYSVTITATDSQNNQTQNNIAFFDPYTCTGGGDHGGANWDPTTDCATGIAGTHTNIATFSLTGTESEPITAYNGTNFGVASISAATISIPSGTTITADGKGYPSGGGSSSGPGAGASGGGSGGGYGGQGGSGTSTPKQGGVYGSLLTPTEMGSGGGGSGSSSGGGAIILFGTASVTIDGTITANANDAGGTCGGSAGSGGSVYIQAGVLAGAGTIRANGGKSATGCGGGGAGGGGRIALYSVNAHTFSGTVTVTAGTSGWFGNGLTGIENGTAFILDSSANDLTIPTANGRWYTASNVFSYHNVTINANVTLQSSSAAQFKLTATGTTTFASGITVTLGGSNTTNTNGTGVYMNLAGNVTIPSTTTINGIGTAGGSSSAANSSVQQGYTGGINTTSGNGPGGGVWGTSSAGGGYGGTGGFISGGTGGSTYGSTNFPTDLGSGGTGASGSYIGGMGGGQLRMLVGGTLTVNGSIDTSGGAGGGGCGEAGGSGGSIWITTASLAGTGTIQSLGGAGATGCGGPAGGGGRIAVYYSSTNSWGGNTLSAAVATTAGTNHAGTSANNGTVVLAQKNVPSETLAQYQSDCTTTIASGGTMSAGNGCLAATITDGDNPDIETLDIETETNSTSFTNTATYTISNIAMSGVANKQTQTISVTIGQSYHWQARVTDQYGFTSGWIAMGGNPDFTASVVAPTNLITTYVSDTQFNLSWSYSGPSSTGFSIERSINGGAYSVINTTSGTSTTTYSDTSGLAANEQAQYRVRTFFTSGGTSYSTYATGVVSYTTPSAPSTISLAQNNVGSITLSWTNNSPYAQNFTVQRKIGTGSYTTVSTSVSGTATTYTDTNVQQALSYTYQVKATVTTPTTLASSYVQSSNSITPSVGFGKGIYLTSTGTLIVENDVKNSIDVFNNVENNSTDQVGQNISYDTTHPSNGPIFPTSTTINDLTVKEGVSAVDGKSDVIYAATNNGLFAINQNAATPANGAIKIYTKDYISELMVGDTRGMWPLDSGYGNGLSDASSHSQTLTNNGSATFVSGVRGNGVSLNGTTQYLSIADNTNLSVTGTVSFGGWFKTTSTSTAQTILAKNGSYTLSLTNSGILQASITGTTTATRTGATTVDTNWHYAVAVYNPATLGLDIYLDGKLDDGSLSGTIPTSITDSTGAFNIGANAGSTLFNGTIDETFVSAATLTSGEVSSMYLSGWRALQNHTASRIPGITGADTYQQLAGNGAAGATVNKVTSIAVDSTNQFMYVGTNDTTTDTGGVSVIGVGSDSLADVYATVNTGKVDNQSAAFIANDVSALSVVGTPNPAFNGQTDTGGVGGIVVIAGTNDTNSGVWMESQQYSLMQVLSAATGPNTNSNVLHVNNLFTVGNALATQASSSGEIQFLPAFQVNQQGEVVQNYLGTDTTAAAVSFADSVITTGTTVSIAANALTTGNALAVSTTSQLLSGSLVNFSSIASGSGNSVLTLSNTGATTGTDYSLYSTATGLSTTNVAGYFSASNATNNYGLLIPNGFVGIGTTAPLDELDVRGVSGTTAVASVSANTSYAALLVDNGGVGDILTASTSGQTRLQITNAGSIIPGITNSASIGSSSLQFANLFAQNIYSNGTLLGNFQVNSGVISPQNILNDFTIGGVSTSSAKFQIFGTTGNATTTGTLTFNSGTAANNLIAAVNNQGLTIGNSNTGNIIFNGGNVGIGTTLPGNPLAVSFAGTVPAISVANTTTNSYTQLAYTGTGRTFYTGVGNGSETTFGVANKYYIFDNNAAAMRLVIDTAGNVGIGTTNPGNPLSIVENGTAANLSLTNNSGTNYTQLSYAATGRTYNTGVGNASETAFGVANKYYIFDNNANLMRMVIDSSGNIGIGTTSPLATLGVIGTSGTTPVASVSGTTSNAAFIVTNNGIGDLITASSSGTTRFKLSNTGDLNLNGYATLAASLAVGYTSQDAGIGNAIFAGSVGIGTTAPPQTLSIAGNVQIYNTATGRGDIYAQSNLNKTWNTSSNFNESGATFSAGMTNPAVNNHLKLNTTSPMDPWLYRETITINNTNGGALTNYQASVSANTSTPITGGKMNSDCSDIRITDSDGTTLLNYWIESGCNTSSTLIWIKVPSISAFSSKTIYMYYGNPSAAAASSGTNTFDFFDDFSGSTLDSTNWGATGSQSVSGSNVTVTNGAIYTKNTLASNPGEIIEASMKWSSFGTFIGMGIGSAQGMATGNSGGIKTQMLLNNNTSSTIVGFGNNTGAGYNIANGLTQFTATAGTYYTVSMGMNTDHIYFYNNRVLTNAYAGTWSPTTPLYLWFGEYQGNQAGTSTGTVVVDWTLARQFDNTPPILSVGSETSYGFTSGLQSWTSGTIDAGAGNTYKPSNLTVQYTLDGSDNIAPKFQIEGSNTGSFTGEQTVYPAGFATYYQAGSTYPITNGTQLDVSTQVTAHFRYWKVIAYMDTGATTTDSPAISSIQLQDYAPAVSFLASGNVGIGITTPAFKFDVRDAQVATLAAMITNLDTGTTGSVLGLKTMATTAGTSNNFITFLDGKGEIIGKVTGTGSGGVSYTTTGIDFAEYFKKDVTAESLTPGTVVCQGAQGVTACTTGGHIVGVISDRAGFTGGSEHAGDPNYTLVGLVGQLPVKIASDSGIVSGDHLMIDATGTATKATKAGETVGIALQDASAAVNGMIMTAINASWYDPSLVTTNGLLSASQSASVLANIQNVPLLTADMATISGTLNVLGRTTLTDLGVTGTFSDGLISIHGLEGEIDTLAGDLMIQSQGLGGVNFLNGLVMIDTSGNITTKGVLSAAIVQTNKVNINTTGIAPAVGEGFIPVGSTSATINTNAVTGRSIIFVTAKTKTNQPLSVTKQIQGKSFTVEIEQALQTILYFNWWVIN